MVMRGETRRLSYSVRGMDASCTDYGVCLIAIRRPLIRHLFSLIAGSCHLRAADSLRLRASMAGESTLEENFQNLEKQRANNKIMIHKIQLRTKNDWMNFLCNDNYLCSQLVESHCCRSYSPMK